MVLLKIINTVFALFLKHFWYYENMKKKLFVLSVLALLSSLSLTGCSFMPDVISGEENQTNTGDGTSYDSKEGFYIKDGLPLFYKMVSGIHLENIVNRFSVDDVFIKPTVYLNFEDGSKIDISSSSYLSITEPDMSKEDSQTLKVSFTCYIKNGSSYSKGTLSNSYTIYIYERNDIHIDPEDDLVTKTLQIANVVTNFTEGDKYIKPKVFAVKHDNSKTEVTNSCTFEGFTMDNPGVQEVTITYGSHTLTYDITVKPKVEDSNFPMIQSNKWLNYYRKVSVIDEAFTLFLFQRDINGTKSSYQDRTIVGQQYSSSDETIATVTDKGVVTAKKAGTAYIYFSFPVTTSSGAKETLTFRCTLTVEEKDLVSFDVNSYRTSYYSGTSINFSGNFTATYQNGYQENVEPDIDLSDVNLNVPGEYVVHVSYTVNGKTKTEDLTITILDSAQYKPNKVELDYDINDYLLNTNLGVTALPHSGTLKSLVVPVKFTDTDNYITNYSNVKSDLNDLFFGTNESVGWRSVKTYYETESMNKITFTGKVSDWYDTGKPSTYYYDVMKINELKEEIVDWYFTQNPSEDRKSYDVDGDGYIDGLNLVYGSLDRTTGDLHGTGANQMWAMVMKRNYPAPNVNNPVSDAFLWMSYDMIYPTKAIALARTGKSDYSYSGRWGYGPATLKLDPTTAIHETGHMFGISDYYSYTEDDVYYAGHTNMQTLNILGHDPYSVILYDWADPYIPEVSSTINIGDFQNTHDVILLTPNWNSDNSPFDEYFLVELYAPTGNNEYEAFTKMTNYGNGTSALDYQTVGVRIWHVDARLATKASNFTELTTNPVTPGKVSYIANNSKGDYNEEGLEDYKDYVELQLVRNDTNYDLMTSSYFYYTQFFQTGDEFDMSTYSSQFMNGNKMNDGRTLPWKIKVKGIYHEGNAYSADIELIKTN